MVLTNEEDSWDPPPAHAQAIGVAQPQAQRPANASGNLLGAPVPTTLEEQTNIFVYENTNPSVVNINTTSIQQDHFFMRQWQTEGSGSGAVLDTKGHIITNYHVIEDADQIEVNLASNQSFLATLVGGDKEQDIAVLKIEAPATDLQPIAQGNSSNLRVGQRVYALGNPFGWDGTLTTGIISSLNRDLPSRVPGRPMRSLIQTDAAMNPGNSGGPLLNTQGQMIGMCVAISTKTGQNAGVGFAIPIDRIKRFVPELIKNGRIVRANIGIVEVVETEAGLVVRRLVQGGPAQKAGVRGYRKIVQRRQQGGVLYQTVTIDRSQADLILAVDGEPMLTGVQFRDKIWEYQPGNVVQLTVLRDGKKIQIPITLVSD
ncbi:MAG: trypsin-like serine protease [Planctomycetes bacterium]|nr:trypsin-like serine protease [Planctomycetota bacterium]